MCTGSAAVTTAQQAQPLDPNTLPGAGGGDDPNGAPGPGAASPPAGASTSTGGGNGDKGKGGGNGRGRGGGDKGAVKAYENQLQQQQAAFQQALQQQIATANATIQQTQQQAQQEQAAAAAERAQLAVRQGSYAVSTSTGQAPSGALSTEAQPTKPQPVLSLRIAPAGVATTGGVGLNIGL